MNEMVGNLMTLSNMNSLMNNLSGVNENSRNVSLKLGMLTRDIQGNAADKISGVAKQPKGYHIAMTHNKVQSSSNTNELTYGTLTSDSVSNGIVIFDNLFEPQIIASLLFVICEDIYPTAGIEEILEKTYIASGIEILDSRVKNWIPNLSLDEMISDNSLIGQVVVGNLIKASSADSFENIEVSLTCDSELVSKGSSKSLVIDPLNAMHLLINKLAMEGKFLKKGMIIANGLYTMPAALYKGEYHADFGSLGDVTLRVR